MSVTVCRVTIVKDFGYRGVQEEFSNSYAFKGGPPSEGDDASWLQLFTDVFLQEQLIYTVDVRFVRAYGYNSSDPKAHHVAQHDWMIPGPPPLGARTRSGVVMAGDQAALIEWKMNRLSVKGKPIYLRKFIHNGDIVSTGGDDIEGVFQGHLETFAGSTGIQSVHGGLRTGLDNAKTGAAPPNDSVVAHLVSPFATTRTLKRRGKRPRTGN